MLGQILELELPSKVESKFSINNRYTRKHWPSLDGGHVGNFVCVQQKKLKLQFNAIANEHLQMGEVLRGGWKYDLGTIHLRNITFLICPQVTQVVPRRNDKHKNVTGRACRTHDCTAATSTASTATVLTHCLLTIFQRGAGSGRRLFLSSVALSP